MSTSASSTTRTLQPIPLSSVRTRRQSWAYQDFVPIGVPTVLAGRGGIGKSTILAWLTAGVTQGELRGDLYGEPSNVAFISAEDDSATTLAPRLQAAGADLSRVFDLSQVKVTREDGSVYGISLPTIAEDLPRLKQALQECGSKLLVIDPVVSMMDGDSIRASDVRRNLDPVAALAASLDIAVVLVMHFGKGAGSAGDRVSGSHAFRDIARSVLLLAVDEETDNRVLSVDKSNYSQASTSLAFNIRSATIITDDGSPAVVGQAQLLGTTALTVQDILNRESDRNLGDKSTRILELVRERPEGVTPAEVEEALGLNANTVRSYLRRLEESGRVQRADRGRYIPAPSAPTATSATTATEEDALVAVVAVGGGCTNA